MKFVPKGAKYLLLGSFAGKQTSDPNYWFYVTKVNQFWPILQKVYQKKLETRQDKEMLFSKLKIAISDIIYQCERAKSSNLDNNLINIVYNTPVITEILQQNKIEKIFFSSRFVENKFKKLFKDAKNIELITLPSPSPRYAAMTKQHKINRYKELLPKLTIAI